jgi:Zn-dependent protease
MRIFDSLSWYVIFLISVTLHEAAHAWAAKKGGDLTAYWGGQVSLNPLPHIRREPFGMVILPIISSLIFGWPFGYASAPYDVFWADRHPRRAAWMGLAGPAANLGLVLLCVVVIRLGLAFEIFKEPDTVSFRYVVDTDYGVPWSGSASAVSMVFSLNLILTVLNLIPFPPLDGSSILSLLLSEDSARKYQSIIRNPLLGVIGFFLVWKLFNPLFDIIFVIVVNLVYPGMNYQ